MGGELWVKNFIGFWMKMFEEEYNILGQKKYQGKVIVDLFFWWEIAKTDLRGVGRGLFFLCVWWGRL